MEGDKDIRAWGGCNQQETNIFSFLFLPTPLPTPTTERVPSCWERVAPAGLEVHAGTFCIFLGEGERPFIPEFSVQFPVLPLAPGSVGFLAALGVGESLGSGTERCQVPHTTSTSEKKGGNSKQSPLGKQSPILSQIFQWSHWAIWEKWRLDLGDRRFSRPVHKSL